VNEADASLWSEKLSTLVAGLSQLTGDEFLDARNGAPLSASRELDQLCGAFAIDRDDWKRFMDANSQPGQNWLPIEPAKIETMDVREIYYRLKENVADERWVENALVEAFRSGSLICAIEKIEAKIRSFDLALQ
jgi:hypothetical protein